jgi:hypothetical protein
VNSIAYFMQQGRRIREDVYEYLVAICPETLRILPGEIIAIGLEKSVAIKPERTSKKTFKRVCAGKNGDASQSSLFLVDQDRYSEYQCHEHERFFLGRKRFRGGRRMPKRAISWARMTPFMNRHLVDAQACASVALHSISRPFTLHHSWPHSSRFTPAHCGDL